MFCRWWHARMLAETCRHYLILIQCHAISSRKMGKGGFAKLSGFLRHGKFSKETMHFAVRDSRCRGFAIPCAESCRLAGVFLPYGDSTYIYIFPIYLAQISLHSTLLLRGGTRFLFLLFRREVSTWVIATLLFEARFALQCRERKNDPTIIPWEIQR